MTAAAVVLLSMSSVGCVVAATGTDTADEKSQTQELDTTDTTTGSTTTNGVAPRIPDSEKVQAGGQGGGPDPSPWRGTEETANGGGPNGPDPSPWDVNPNTSPTKSK